MARHNARTKATAEVTVLRCLDAFVEVRAENADVDRELACLYRNCILPGVIGVPRTEIDIRTHEGRYVVAVDGTVVATCSDTRAMFVAVSVEIDRAAVEMSSDSYVILHGACISRGGRSALVVGPSGAGKSTLAAALTLAGFQYVGDEVLGLRVGTTDVEAYPKPFKLDGRSRSTLEKSFPRRGVAVANTDHEMLLAAHTFGSVTPTGLAATPMLVVMPMIADVPSAAVETLSRPDVAELLSDQCFNFARWGPRALTTVAAVARECVGVRVRFTDLEDATRAIGDLMQ